MANSFAKSKMAALFEETASTTSINMTLSKDLETYDMSDMANEGRTDNTAGTGSDVEYIPQEYRFTVQDGIVSTDGDFQDITDRMIPVRRTLAKRVLARISTQDLRDDYRRERVAKGMAKDIANAVDITAYQTMINQASMVQAITGDFDYNTAIDAETLMLNRGLSAYEKKLFLSNRHYAKVAQSLGQAARDTMVNDAVQRAKLPPLATFDTMRSDYLINLAGNTTSGLTINGNQSHTVATYNASGFFQDNRQMTLNITGATAANMPVGTKFTIAGVNALNPETRTNNGSLQTFTVLSSASGSVVCSPAIVISGPYANCSAQAANGSNVVILNIAANAPSLFYTPESTVLIPGRLPVPTDAGGVEKVDAVTENGLPMRMTYWYDPHNEVFNIKTLIYFDVQVIHPEMVGVILDKQV